MSWDPKTLADTINEYLTSMSVIDLRVDTPEPIQLLIQKGNIVRKYQTLSHINISSMPVQLLARIITADDDDIIFSCYRQYVYNDILINWITAHGAKAIAFAILPDITGLETTCPENFHALASLAIKHSLKQLNDMKVRMLHTISGHISSHITRINLWAEHDALNGDAQYDYWKTCPEDYVYRDIHMCLVRHTCSGAEDIASMWKSIYYHRRELRHDPRIHSAVMLIRTTNRNDQVHAWSRHLHDHPEIIAFASSNYFALSRNTHECSGLYIPYANLGKQRYQEMIVEQIYPCNHVIEHMLHMLYDQPDTLHTYYDRYFNRCIDALHAMKTRIDSGQHKAITNTLFAYWLPRAEEIESGPYVRYFPLLDHIEQICPLAKTDYCIYTTLVGQLRRHGSLDIVPTEHLATIITGLPEFINVQHFNQVPQIALKTLEKSQPHMSPEMQHTILHWLLINDQSSILCTSNNPVIDDIAFGEYLSKCSANMHTLASTSRNFNKMHTHVLYYYIPSYRDRCANIDIPSRALVYGLSIHGQLIDEDILSMNMHRSVQALPHIMLADGYDGPVWTKLFNLYDSKLDKIELTTSAFSTLLTFDMNILKRWIPLHRDCEYDMTDVDMSIMSRDLLLSCMANNIIDMNTVEQGSLTEELRAELAAMPFCSICQLSIVPKCKAETNCGHIFHMRCIATWLEEHDTCPMCRANMSDGYNYYV